MTTTANSGFQSYQLHPDDAYAEKHENQKGKVSGAVALKASDHVSEWLFGNKAKNLEDFKRMVENKDWKNLFSTIFRPQTRNKISASNLLKQSVKLLMTLLYDIQYF